MRLADQITGPGTMTVVAASVSVLQYTDIPEKQGISDIGGFIVI